MTPMRVVQAANAGQRPGRNGVAAEGHRPPQITPLALGAPDVTHREVVAGAMKEELSAFQDDTSTDDRFGLPIVLGAHAANRSENGARRNEQRE